MRIAKLFSATLLVFSLVVCSCKSTNQAPKITISGAITQQPALQTVRGQQGGAIIYGAAPGAGNQAGGLTYMLKTVHNDCGEQPKVGQPFQFTGTQMVGVFFTVANHSQGNEQLAGLALATLSGPNQVKAALVYDDASRIGSTVNPLLDTAFQRVEPRGAGGHQRLRRHNCGSPRRAACGGGGPTAYHHDAGPDSQRGHSERVDYVSKQRGAYPADRPEG